MGTRVNGSTEYKEYYKMIQEKLRMVDEKFGNKDGKVSVEEMQIAFQKGPLAVMTGIQDLAATKGENTILQSSLNKNSILFAYRKIPEAIKKYAGQDKEYSVHEYEQLVNSKEWKEFLRASIDTTY